MRTVEKLAALISTVYVPGGTRENQQSNGQHCKSTQSHTLSPVQSLLGKSLREKFRFKFLQETPKHYHHPEAPKKPGNHRCCGQFNYLLEGMSRANLSWQQGEIYMNEELALRKAVR